MRIERFRIWPRRIYWDGPVDRSATKLFLCFPQQWIHPDGKGNVNQLANIARKIVKALPAVIARARQPDQCCFRR